MNFFKKLLRNKLILSISCFFIFGFLFFPLVASAAEWWDIAGRLSAMGNDVAQAILGSIFGLAMSIPLMFLNVALELLTWVASGNFLVVSFTGADNTIVTTGWTFVRNLANVVLIFGLVLIALSIILGYQETKAKKMLVDFILIAVLINFTPVICGLFIDGAKIIMDLLLKGGLPPDFSNFMKTKMFESGATGVADIPTVFVLAAFCIFAAVVYFLFALLFLVRVVMLWILIILSPIAFATKVLPQSKYIMRIFPSICTWDEWWNNFLQWTFMGIPAAGAIWLSNLIMFTIAQNPNAITSVPSGNVLSGTLGLLFSYTIPFIVLVVGFFITLDSGGAAGGVIKGVANKAVGVIKGAPVGAALGFASGAIAGANQAGIGGSIVGAFKGSAQGTLTGGEREKEQIGRWYQRNIKEGLGLTTAGTTAAAEGKNINKIASTYKNLDETALTRETQQYATTPKNIDEKMAGILETVRRGNNLRDEEITWMERNRENLEEKGADLHSVVNYAPELAPRLLPPDRATGAPAEVGPVVTGMPASKVIDIRAQSLNSFEVIDNLNLNQVEKILKDGSADQVNNLREWISDPARNHQLLTRLDDLENRLTTHRAGGMPGVPALTQQQAIETERRFNNLSRSILAIRDSSRATPTP
jgi:hypothetical protein